MKSADIGHLVRKSRHVLGISQARLAKLSGFSRATISQLETGTIGDLGAVKLMGLLDLLGVRLNGTAQRAAHNALQPVSQTASLSYKHRLPRPPWLPP